MIFRSKSNTGETASDDGSREMVFPLIIPKSKWNNVLPR